MEKLPKSKTSYLEEENKREKWAKEVAGKFQNVEFTGEYFELPFYDVAGKEIKRVHIHAWEKLPLYDESGNAYDAVKIEVVIAAIQKFPYCKVSEAIKKFQTEAKAKAKPE